MITYLIFHLLRGIVFLIYNFLNNLKLLYTHFLVIKVQLSITKQYKDICKINQSMQRPTSRFHLKSSLKQPADCRTASFENLGSIVKCILNGYIP